MASTPISVDDSRDPLRKMRVYQLADDLMSDCFVDAGSVLKNPITTKIASQLYYAAGSISANIAEGYSRASGKDRARYFEYSLGSVRETMAWYRSSRPVLDAEVVTDRLDRLEEMRRMLLAIIPRERDRSLRKKRTPVRE